MARLRTRPSMTAEPVAGLLFRLSLPMIAVSLGIILFNLTDTYFVGKLGALPLAALSFTFPVVLFTGSISMGLGVGTSVLVSHALGAGDRKGAARSTTDAHVLTALVSAVIMVAGILTIDPLFRMLGAKPEVIPMIRDYMVIWYLGMPLVVVSMTSTQVIQAGGDTRTPGILMIISVGANILLDPVLIFGLGPVPSLGIKGAAIATVAARSSAMIFSVLIVARREKLFASGETHLAEMVASWGSILHIGLPAALVNMMRPFSMGIITRLVSRHGLLAVAGYGVATRLETFALIFVIAIAMVITPFTGQNAGARAPSRIRTGVRYGVLFSIGWSLVALVLFVFFARPLAGVFNDSQEVVTVAGIYLTTMAVSYGFEGAVTMVNASFNGLKMPWTATAIAFIRMFAFYVPLAWVGSVVFGLRGLFAGAALGNILSGITSIIWFEKRIGRQINQP